MNNQTLINFIRETYSSDDLIPLHEPTFLGNEKKYVSDTLDSTFVSSIGGYVGDFERAIEDYTQCKKAVAVVNGTTALYTALYCAGITRGDLVITQALTFVATCNAIKQLGAEPVFIDVSSISLGLCPLSTKAWLEDNAFVNEYGECLHKKTNRKIKAILPMHTFGHPVDLNEFVEICENWCLTLIEDAAESLGSLYRGKHTGTFGKFSAISFNGNKIITTGGGGAVLCGELIDAQKTKHITTTARIADGYHFSHDEVGFNYRMPNINAALGCAQFEYLHHFVKQKWRLASRYQAFFEGSIYDFFTEPDYAQSNYWLNTIICPNIVSRDKLLKATNDQKILTRPVWRLMHHLPMFKDSIRGNLSVSEDLEGRLLNLPSTPVKGDSYA